MLAKTEQPLSLNFFAIWRHSPNSSEREAEGKEENEPNFHRCQISHRF
jgi:hypothetical protein